MLSARARARVDGLVFISKPFGVLKIMVSDGTTLECWKARLESGQGQGQITRRHICESAVKTILPTKLCRKLPANKQYMADEWAAYIESGLSTSVLAKEHTNRLVRYEIRVIGDIAEKIPVVSA